MRVVRAFVQAAAMCFVPQYMYKFFYKVGSFAEVVWALVQAAARRCFVPQYIYKFFYKVGFFAEVVLSAPNSCAAACSLFVVIQSESHGQFLGTLFMKVLAETLSHLVPLEVFWIWWLLSLFTTSICRVGLTRALFEKFEKLPPFLEVWGMTSCWVIIFVECRQVSLKACAAAVQGLAVL